MAPSRPPRPPSSRLSRDPQDLLKKRGADLIRKIADKDRYGIFIEPVDPTVVDGYLDIIKRPMDISTCQKNLSQGVYRTPMELRADLDLIWSNCCIFNPDDSIFYKEAVRLRSLSVRYYDDLVRLLSRDGVAHALGLASGLQNPSARTLAKRPPPHRSATPSLRTSNPTSPDPDDASGSASASAPHSSTVRNTQLRKARVAAETAEEKAKAAEVVAKRDAQEAGIPPPVDESVQQPQIFAGPRSVLANGSTGTKRWLEPREFPILQNANKKDRCAQVPLAWRRVGRSYGRGGAVSKFNTEERKLEVRLGRRYERFVDKNAPIARRLLATLLDPEAVRRHDLDTIANGLKAEHEKRIAKYSSNDVDNERAEDHPQRGRVQNGMKRRPELINGHSPMANGISKRERITLENGVMCTKSPQLEERPKKRQRRMSGDGKTKTPGEKFVADLIEQAASTNSERLAQGREGIDNGKTAKYPSKRAIYKLQGLLKERNMEWSFIRGLVKSTAYADPKYVNEKEQREEEARVRAEDLQRLLNANQNMMLNLQRLRSLRENAEEADREDLEDVERECAEQLARGVALATQKVAPKHVVHGMDLAECTVGMSQSVIEYKEDSKQ